jgi:hypothetical protein
MTRILSFDPEGSGICYGARVLHWSRADRQSHEAMGFLHKRWGKATNQRAALVATL